MRVWREEGKEGEGGRKVGREGGREVGREGGREGEGRKEEGIIKKLPHLKSQVHTIHIHTYNYACICAHTHTHRHTHTHLFLNVDCPQHLHEVSLCVFQKLLHLQVGLQLVELLYLGGMT